jgi:adenine-specific DNA-methyltransferase
LRPFLLEAEAREIYREVVSHGETRRFGDLANIGIGYVSGANDFFHFRPSQARLLEIPSKLLYPTVRNGRALPARRLTASTVARWRRDDEQMMLLRIPKQSSIPSQVVRYLDSDAGHVARTAYKCRVRDPWYSVPDVQVPDFFLSYMSGLDASLVRNDAACTCTNSVHSVRLRQGVDVTELMQMWESTFTRLSCEIEGHPLGGGMLKLEPREASEIVLPSLAVIGRLKSAVIGSALSTMREWRHYAAAH